MTDEQILTALHLRDHEGMQTIDIAVLFGTTKNAMIGRLYRVNQDADASDPDRNQNGTLKPEWWKKRSKHT